MVVIVSELQVWACGSASITQSSSSACQFSVGSGPNQNLLVQNDPERQCMHAVVSYSRYSKYCLSSCLLPQKLCKNRKAQFAAYHRFLHSIGTMDYGSDLLTIVGLKGVNDILWHQLDGPSKRALRLLNKAAHQETYTCVRQLSVFLADDELASQLALFPRLHSLCLDANSKTPGSNTRASAADLARFLKAPVASTRIQTLILKHFRASLQQAAAVLPAALLTSLCKMTLWSCSLRDGMLAPMVTQCSNLTHLELQQVEVSSPDAVTALGSLTQASGHAKCLRKRCGG